MSILEEKVDALIQLCTTNNPNVKTDALWKLEKLAKASESPVMTDPEGVTQELLLELGSPDHLIGHPYTVAGILMAVADRRYVENITFGLYPAIAAKFDTTAARVERAIRHLVEVTWSRGDTDVLMRYFGNTVSPVKGKPTNGEFISRCATIVAMRLKHAGK